MSPSLKQNEEGCMKLTVSKQGYGLTILRLIGRMDIEGADQVDLRLNVAAAEDGALLIVDLSEVDFMSSIGIGGLVRVANAIRRRGGNLVLLNPQSIVRLVLETTHIYEVIAICNSLDEAMSAVQEMPKKRA
jgi:anti-anti-sigma factor